MLEFKTVFGTALKSNVFLRQHSKWIWGTTQWQSTVTGYPEKLWVEETSPSLETFKHSLDMILCNMLWMNWFHQGGWTKWPPELSSNFLHSVIIWKFRRDSIKAHVLPASPFWCKTASKCSPAWASPASNKIKRLVYMWYD